MDDYYGPSFLNSTACAAMVDRQERETLSLADVVSECLSVSMSYAVAVAEKLQNLVLIEVGGASSWDKHATPQLEYGKKPPKATGAFVYHGAHLMPVNSGNLAIYLKSFLQIYNHDTTAVMTKGKFAYVQSRMKRFVSQAVQSTARLNTTAFAVIYEQVKLAKKNVRQHQIRGRKEEIEALISLTEGEWLNMSRFSLPKEAFDLPPDLVRHHLEIKGCLKTRTSSGIHKKSTQNTMVNARRAGDKADRDSVDEVAPRTANDSVVPPGKYLRQGELLMAESEPEN